MKYYDMKDEILRMFDGSKAGKENAERLFNILEKLKKEITQEIEEKHGL